jgi:hypothetical protein
MSSLAASLASLSLSSSSSVSLLPKTVPSSLPLHTVYQCTADEPHYFSPSQLLVQAKSQMEPDELWHQISPISNFEIYNGYHPHLVNLELQVVIKEDYFFCPNCSAIERKIKGPVYLRLNAVKVPVVEIKNRLDELEYDLEEADSFECLEILTNDQDDCTEILDVEVIESVEKKLELLRSEIVNQFRLISSQDAPMPGVSLDVTMRVLVILQAPVATAIQQTHPQDWNPFDGTVTLKNINRELGDANFSIIDALPFLVSTPGQPLVGVKDQTLQLGVEWVRGVLQLLDPCLVFVFGNEAKFIMSRAVDQSLPITVDSMRTRRANQFRMVNQFQSLSLLANSSDAAVQTVNRIWIGAQHPTARQTQERMETRTQAYNIMKVAIQTLKDNNINQVIEMLNNPNSINILNQDSYEYDYSDSDESN